MRLITLAIIGGLLLPLLGQPALAEAATTKTPAKTAPAKVVPAKTAPVKATPAKATTAKKTTAVKKKTTTVKKNTVVCASCKSLAEGVDKSKAAKANSWKGLVIGVNEGERSLVITEATKLDKIKAYPQRNVLILANTQIKTLGGEYKDFVNLDIGQTVYVEGNYNATTRVIRATSVEVK